MNKFQLLKNDLLKIEKELEVSKERDVVFTNEDQQIEIFMASCVNELKMKASCLELTAEDFENNWNNIEPIELSDHLNRRVKRIFMREEPDNTFNWRLSPDLCVSFRKTGETSDDSTKVQSAIEKARNLLKNKKR